MRQPGLTCAILNSFLSLNASQSLKLSRYPHDVLSLPSFNGERMDHYWTGMQLILSAFVFVLIVIFAAAAFLDSRFRKTSSYRGFRSERDSFILRSTGSDEGVESVFEESPAVLNTEGIRIAAK
jgi:hypothetical protein